MNRSIMEHIFDAIYFREMKYEQKLSCNLES